MKKKADQIADERTRMERLEQQRIDYEHRARLTRANLYNTVPPRDSARGWVDPNRK